MNGEIQKTPITQHRGIQTSPKKRQLSRRDTLKVLALGAGSVAYMNLFGCSTDPKPTPWILSDIPTSAPLDVGDFPQITVPEQKIVAEGWDAERIVTELTQAVNRSLETQQEIELQLPEGEIVIDKQIKCVLPKEAKIKLVGHPNGSKLRLDEKLSDIPKEWGSFAEHNLLFFENMEGDLTLQGIHFDGGSKRAGKFGYQPPKSPWDAVVFVVGAGDGNKYESAMDRKGNRNGKVTVQNCIFTNSESEGIMMQNLSEAHISNCVGQNLDVGVNSCWTDTITIENYKGENFTSDGFYISSAATADLKDCDIKTARQAYDLQGLESAILTNCHAHDAGKGWEITLSETDKETVSGTVELNNCNSKGCNIVYSIGPVKNLAVKSARHDDCGKWWEGYYRGDFLHKDGIVRPEDINNTKTPLIEYTLLDSKGNKITLKKKISFKDVQIRIYYSPVIHYNRYRYLPKFNGISYSRMPES